MTSVLRQIIAGSRAKHAESNLDLCYVTPFIIATSGPRGTYPQRAYRNPLDQFVKFLDDKHGENWCIWEFRAEGTGYPDEEVYGRVRHYPWPDHHPPPFAIVPLVMGGMKKWLNAGPTPVAEAQSGRRDSNPENGKVVVVHCRAGKGRSGTIACAYLIAECGWTAEEALTRFTERRMRPGFGQGVSILSQLRWIGYVDRWAKWGKIYVDRPIEILEVHVWGLREGVRVAVEGYIEEGKVIKTFHTFSRTERIVVEGNAPGGSDWTDMVFNMIGYNKEIKTLENVSGETSNFEGTVERKQDKDGLRITLPNREESPEPLGHIIPGAGEEPGGKAVVFKPSNPIVVRTSDISIDFQRRGKTVYGLTMVTAVAHVWFNAFFEGNGPENSGIADDTGVFEIDWDKMDGIKGSIRKGTRALDRLAVIWRVHKPNGKVPEENIIHEPTGETPIPQMSPANWRGAQGTGDNLDFRIESLASAIVNRASSSESFVENNLGRTEVDHDSVEGVKTSGPEGEENVITNMKTQSTSLI